MQTAEHRRSADSFDLNLKCTFLAHQAPCQVMASRRKSNKYVNHSFCSLRALRRCTSFKTGELALALMGVEQAKSNAGHLARWSLSHPYYWKMWKGRPNFGESSSSLSTAAQYAVGLFNIRFDCFAGIRVREKFVHFLTF